MKKNSDSLGGGIFLTHTVGIKAYTVSLVVYTHTRQFLQAEHGEQFFNISLV